MNNVLKTLLRLSPVLLFVLAAAAMPARAAECGHKYTVKTDDTLSSISREVYGTSAKWTLIFYANQMQFDNKPLLHVGGQLRIPCLRTPQSAEAGAKQAKKQRKIETSKVKADIQLLTADDFRPFTDRALPAGGMITDIVDTALKTLKQESNALAHQVSWVNDWSAHLNPLLVRKTFDMGFPWYRPDCGHLKELDTPARFRCEKFFFSKPVFETLVMFFARKDSGFTFGSDADVVGKRLCRPAGYFTFDLDQNGRNWIRDEKVTLLRPQGVGECFRLLERGEVDAVAINEFTGREAVRTSGMSDKVRVIEQPVSLLSLHVVVAKTHPRARTYLHYINSSLSRIRETGAYHGIIDRHLTAFWSGEDGS